MSTADSDDPSGITELATQAIGPIEQELRQRLSVETDERDALALETALLKAFISGMQAGSSETAESAIGQFAISDATHAEYAVSPAQLETSLPHLDPWAERYGDGS